MAEKLKIMMTSDTIGGVWTYTVDLCRALQDYPVEIHLLTFGAFPTKAHHIQLNELSNVHLYESNFKLEWMDDPWRDLENALQWMNRIYLKVRPDLLHFNNYGQAAEFWNTPSVTVLHSCVQTWWKSVKGESAPESWDRYKKLVRKAIHQSNTVVAPSFAMLEQTKCEYGNIQEASVIYNGSFNTGLSLKKEPFIFSAGRLWDEAKNIRLLLKISDRLSWPLYIAGDNEGHGSAEDFSSHHVHFFGKLTQEEMKEQMAKASIFVMPSTYEPFGLAVLEAARSGCALVLSDIASFREIWGDNAVYFDPAKPKQAIEIIEKLIANVAFREEMALKALARSEFFTGEKMGTNYYRLYRKLVENKVPASAHLIQNNHENSNVLSFSGL
jgi:glycosyltransferase involved in cell wall biosynthesis